jgi:two-component system chemotaxis sensor kinase CheA
VLDEPALLNLIATPGFSTRDEADRAAGRGVGMDVVARTMRELGGQIALATEAGKFTEFTLRLPLTLSIAETFIVSAGDRTCAVPQGFVQEIVQVPAAGLRQLQRVEVAPYRDGVLPLVRLHSLLGLAATARPQLTVLVVESERGAAGLVVDRVHGQREVVVRPMQDPLLRVPGVSGATELGDGKPVLILDPALFTRGAVRPHATAPESSPLAATA